MSLAADQETEDKDETISSTSTQDFDREKVGERIHQPGLSLSTDWRKFQEIGRRSPTYEEVTTSNQSSKNAYPTHDQNG